MKHGALSRRDFLRTGAGAIAGAAAGSLAGCSGGGWVGEGRPVVSIARIRNDNVGSAVEEAVDLLGGMNHLTRGKERIMLKPNLVAESPAFTTKPEVVRTLARLMKGAGKDVLIGEGSAAATGFNVKGDVVYRTRSQAILDPMQQHVFDQLGYTDLARSMGIPLVNLHSGEMVEVDIPGGFASDRITLHHTLQEIDWLCSVPMMKTHSLATVTLGMKNLIGLYPGTVYYSVRSWLHDHAAGAKSPGIAFEIVDMVRANKLGLVVVDGSMAMEGEGPTQGSLVKMDIIVAGTNPLATDMVAASVMGFETQEIPTFVWAQKAGMTPALVSDIEVRGAALEDVRRPFVKPNVIPWESISKIWGVEELS